MDSGLTLSESDLIMSKGYRDPTFDIVAAREERQQRQDKKRNSTYLRIIKRRKIKRAMEKVMQK